MDGVDNVGAELDRARARLAMAVAGFAVGVAPRRLAEEGRGATAVTLGRQVAMYLCHVVYQMSLARVAAAFARDRSTAGHACHMIEERRDDAAFDHLDRRAGTRAPGNAAAARLDRDDAAAIRMSAARNRAGERTLERAIRRLAEVDALLAPVPRQSGYGVFAGKDRRRRPNCRLSEDQTRSLVAEGVVAPTPDGVGYRLTPAGAARVARIGARPHERYMAQHGDIIDRAVMDADGDERGVRGYEPHAACARLVRLKSPHGAPWLTPEEIGAARQLCEDWERGQIGLMRGVDLAAGPQSGNARGPGGGREGALAIGLDARRRVEEALAYLAPALRRVAAALVIEGCGLDDFERRQGWPPRSAKIALKLALAQLASRGRT